MSDDRFLSDDIVGCQKSAVVGRFSRSCDIGLTVAAVLSPIPYWNCGLDGMITSRKHSETYGGSI